MPPPENFDEALCASIFFGDDMAAPTANAVLPPPVVVNTHTGDGVIITYEDGNYFLPVTLAPTLCDLIREGPSSLWDASGLSTTKRGALQIDARNDALMQTLDPVLRLIIAEYRTGTSPMSHYVDWGDML